MTQSQRICVRSGSTAPRVQRRGPDGTPTDGQQPAHLRERLRSMVSHGRAPDREAGSHRYRAREFEIALGPRALESQHRPLVNRLWWHPGLAETSKCLEARLREAEWFDMRRTDDDA